MTEELLLLLANHASGYAVWTPPDQWFAAYFLDGVEMSGGSYTRQPLTFAEAVMVAVNIARAGTSGLTLFDNVPDGDVDEIRIVDTASGAIGLTGWVIPHVRSFAAGDDPGYAPGKIGVNFAGTTAPPA